MMRMKRPSAKRALYACRCAITSHLVGVVCRPSEMASSFISKRRFSRTSHLQCGFVRFSGTYASSSPLRCHCFRHARGRSERPRKEYSRGSALCVSPSINMTLEYDRTLMPVKTTIDLVNQRVARSILSLSANRKRACSRSFPSSIRSGKSSRSTAFWA